MSQQSFQCTESRGITGFDIPPGRTSIFIDVLCGGEMRAEDTSFQVPPPIVRTVQEGKVVTLNALLIVVDEIGCTEPGCTCIPALDAGIPDAGRPIDAGPTIDAEIPDAESPKMGSRAKRDPDGKPPSGKSGKSGSSAKRDPDGKPPSGKSGKSWQFR
jgi:hypothetical protein